jgi:phospholipid/cholesterol/gamma-HCH transport system substrate-binding protein
MKSFQERNPLIIGAIGLTLSVAVALGAVNYDKLPGLSVGKEYSAYFAEAGGLLSGADVRVSGFAAGKVEDITLDDSRVLVTFKVDDDIRLGERSEAAVKTRSALGSKILEITPRGDGRLSGPIPLERTTPAYQLPDAIGDLTTAISGLDTNQLSDSLKMLSETFADTPPDVRAAVEGVGRFTQTLDERDAQLRSLLSNANKATAVLSERSDQIVTLVRDTNALLAALRSESASLDQIFNNISAVSQQLKGFIAENRTQLKPALDKLNGVLAIVDNHKEQVKLALQGLNRYALGLGESVPRTVRPTVRRRGVLRPRPRPQRAVADTTQRPTGGATGHAGTADPVPTNRPGWRSEIDDSRRHHRKSRRSGLRSAGSAVARPDGLLPVPRAVACAAAGRPAAGTSRSGIPGAGVHRHAAASDLRACTR